MRDKEAYEAHVPMSFYFKLLINSYPIAYLL